MLGDVTVTVTTRTITILMIVETNVVPGTRIMKREHMNTDVDAATTTTQIDPVQIDTITTRVKETDIDRGTIEINSIR